MNFEDGENFLNEFKAWMCVKIMAYIKIHGRARACKMHNLHYDTYIKIKHCDDDLMIDTVMKVYKKLFISKVTK